jgi:hypothetical protein
VKVAAKKIFPLIGPHMVVIENARQLMSEGGYTIEGLDSVFSLSKWNFLARAQYVHRHSPGV